MADIDREALLDRVYVAIRTPSRHGSWLAEDAAKAVLPVAAKAITDKVRAAHMPESISYPGERPRCAGCIAECAYCEGDHFYDECPTRRLCDEIDAALGVEGEHE